MRGLTSLWFLTTVVVQVWSREQVKRPARAAFTVLVIALATLLIALAVQIGQGFLHARDVIDKRNAWLAELPASSQLAYGSIDLGGRTIEVWTFDSQAANALRTFPGISSADAPKTVVSPAVAHLMNSSEVAASLFRGAIELDGPGVADQGEFVVFTTASDAAVLGHPLHGPATQVTARSAAVDDVPLWLGMASLILFVMLPACSLLSAATVVGGRPRQARLTVARLHGSNRAAQALAVGEPVLSAVLATAVSVPLIGLWTAATDSLLTVPVVPEVWEIGLREGVGVSAAVIGLTAAAGRIHGRSRSAGANGYPRPWRLPSRLRLADAASHPVQAWAFALGAIALATSVWVPEAYTSLSLWMLGASIWLMALPGFLVAGSVAAGAALSRRPSLKAVLLGARLQRSPQLWVSRWFPLAVAMTLLPACLLAAAVLAESDEAADGPLDAYVLSWTDSTPQTLARALDTIGPQEASLFGATFSRRGSGWRVQADCAAMADRLGMSDCDQALASLMDSTDTPVRISPPRQPDAERISVLLLAASEAQPDAYSQVSRVLERAAPDLVTEVAANSFNESPYLLWALGGIALMVSVATLTVFLILADSSASDPGAKRLHRLGASTRFVSLSEATTFLTGYGIALSVGIAMGLGLLYARLRVDPSLQLSAELLLNAYASMALLGVCGAIAAGLGTYGTLARAVR